MYGLSTDKTLGLTNSALFKHAEFKAYYANTGSVYENGSGRNAGPVVNDGNTVTITADLINWKIIW